ncbi:unnamed protein product [Camellia sinensis]
MGASKDSVVSSRLKREDCKRTKHDSVFSEWKVLIGPSDWEDHSLGKEGAERYRIHNLPNCASCSGLYELGIVVLHTRSGRETSKFDPDRIIPVYVGQADNVRTRLQRYGREGAHLENGKSTGELNDSVLQGRGLFSEIFSRGYSVVYRWAPMKNKRDAEKTEAQVLDTFDYAWNKGGNGVRRPNDILKKLDRSTSRNTKFHVIVKKLQTFRQKKMGIKIEACKPLPWENVSNTYSYQENNDLFSRIFKIGRSQPRLVQLRHGFNEDYASICGVALGHGSVCRRLPVEGRKRCAEHKGLKINGNHLKVEYRASSFSHDTMKPQQVVDDCPVGKDSFPICGVALDDGILCRRQPVRGRKRCEEHKGRKITKSFSESRTKNKQGYLCDPILESSTYGYDSEKILSKTRKMGTTCGVGLKDGTFCIRQPALGKKRCEEHKRMKIIGSKSKLLVADVPNVFDCSGINSCSGQKV